MKYSKLFLQTFKEVPNDAQIPSHQLLLRAGYIQKSGSGLYNYSYLMLRVVDKMQGIIRKELNKRDCLEISLSLTTPGELWQESGRWEALDGLMLQCKDRMGRDICISPTNEEAVVDYFRKIAKSYKQLPICLYQINTKFRDEIRPRFGLMRAREFCMKDGYSFHDSKESLDDTYQAMYDAYSAIFSTLNLEFISVEADGGAMADGNAKTHEFQVVANTGEDTVVICKQENYAANLEAAITKRKSINNNLGNKPCESIETPNKKSIEDVCQFLNIELYHSLKAVVYVTRKQTETKCVIAFCLGDDDVNEVKLTNVIGGDIEKANDKDLKSFGLINGFVGPIKIAESLRSLGNINAGSISQGILSIENGGTGAANMSVFKTNYGLVVGQDIQRYTANLEALTVDLEDGKISGQKIDTSSLDVSELDFSNLEVAQINPKSSSGDQNLYLNNERGNLYLGRESSQTLVNGHLYLNKSFGFKEHFTLEKGQQSPIKGRTYGSSNTNSYWMSKLSDSNDESGILFENGGAITIYSPVGNENTMFSVAKADSNQEKVFSIKQYGNENLINFQGDNAYLYVDGKSGFSQLNLKTSAREWLLVNDRWDNHKFKILSAGMTTPPITIDTSGTVYFNGTQYNTSDKQTKKNVHHIKSSLEKVMLLNPVTFNWDEKQRPEINETTLNYGFIAQDVKKVYPELVHTPEKEGYLSLNSLGLLPILTKAIQELKSEKDMKIAELEEKIDALTHSISTVETQLKHLSHSPSYSSDEQLKEIGAPIEPALTKLKSIDAYEYKWKTTTGYRIEDPQIGVLAQDIKVVFPKLVKTDDNGYLQVNVPGLMAVLVQSINELNTQSTLASETIRQENVELKHKLNEIEKRLDKLQESVNQ